MTLLKTTAFNGTSPRTDPRLLPDNAATVAINTKLQTGTIKPYKITSQVSTLSKTGSIKSIYRFGEEVVGDANYWFHWTADVDVVKGPLSDDELERTYFTGDGVPKMTTNAIALTGGTDYPMNSYILGLPSPALAATASVSGTATEASSLPETRVYTYTYVTALGEEGPPAAASNTVDVRLGQSAVITGMSAAPAGNYNVSTKRIYRSVQGTSGAGYLFVAEIPAANTSYTDSVLAENLGETLQTGDWVAPPDDMAGLCLMANGVMAGFSGKDICFSVPFVPNAWPLAYRLQSDHNIVGIGAFGISLFVGTDAFPYIITGVDPEGMSMVKSTSRQACVSKRSIVDMGGGVFYASPDGICLADGTGVRVLTQSLMTKDEWQAYRPDSINATQIDGRYFAFYDTGIVQGCLILDMTGDGAQLWNSDVYHTALFNDVKTDSLYLASSGSVQKWDSGATNLTYTWKSKIFQLAKPENMGAGQVFAHTYPVTMKVYADGVLIHTEAVANDRPFRLPSGFRAREWQLEVVGTSEVTSAMLAGTVMELTAA
jgi:hypothetical protein